MDRFLFMQICYLCFLIFSPKFVRSFANVGEIMSQAFKDYDAAVKDSSFPAQEHTFKIDE